MEIKQLELFPKEKMDFLMAELKQTRQLTENVQRGLFARFNELERFVLELRERVENHEKA